MSEPFIPPDLPPARRISREGIDLCYYMFGPENGHPLVICHGLAAAGIQFAEDGRFFGEAGYRVLVPDVRGHGQSGRPQKPTPENFGMNVLAEDIMAMMDAEGMGQADWIGNSMGGVIALEVIRQNPEHIRRLLTFGTTYSLSAPAYLVPFLPFLYRLIGPKPIAFIGGWATSKHKPVRRLIRHVLGQFDREILHPLLINLREYDYRQTAVEFDRPILMLRGSLDRDINATLGPTLETMKAKPDFTLIEMPGAGHCANLDQPDAFRSAARRFLETE
ncbi:alpha/beta fold hydrolase [Cucumibacter marinus]|uniref:alpha/beta fold hydrolase n=1 Tax=Cucumibacter marinus TaxID=1121252 RepID=UPI00068589AD|nr:alpha/beta hydrolase [Cucumibacter marinus]